VEETSPRLVGLAERRESKPKGFRGRVEDALDKERVPRQWLQDNYCTWLDSAEATEYEWPPRDQLVSETQNAFRGQARWGTKRMQRVVKTPHVVTKRGDEPPARQFAPAGMKRGSAAWSAVRLDSDDRTSGVD
jgi:hypothetical protein